MITNTDLLLYFTIGHFNFPIHRSRVWGENHYGIYQKQGRRHDYNDLTVLNDIWDSDKIKKTGIKVKDENWICLFCYIIDKNRNNTKYSAPVNKILGH